ncbi:hypothetical protein C0Q70_05260 [Pomacea canaliculata]|uniref:Uncharacterized protein n=1 Tax=Pomacea canaliculata TaxID=400727 RepID=A0A2T7PKR0_POMCA|nr:hypothetical protein C0Q70_05260 [Pomacea canaliculata]
MLTDWVYLWWRRHHGGCLACSGRLMTLKQNTEVRDDELRLGSSKKREMGTQTPITTPY